MRIKVVANELVETDIEMVSLVKHGANRAPFKILKSDDDSPISKLGDKLQNFFSLPKGEYTVTAYFIRKNAADTLLPVLKAAGVDTAQTVERDGVVMVKQADAEARGFIQLTEALALAVDQPIKEFSEESIVKAYAEGVGLSDFAPSVNLAVAGLAESVWSLLNSSADEGLREDRVAKVDGMLASFRKYITSLARKLPEQVFKVEAAARAATTEETDMPKGKLEEAVAGDLDGLTETPVIKQETQTIVGDGPVSSNTTTTVQVAKAETPAEAPVEAPAEAPAAPVEEDKTDAILKALDAINAKVDGLAKAIEDTRVTTDTLMAQVAEVEGLAKSATETARRTTVVDQGANIDLALSTLGGTDSPNVRRQVRKSHDVWDGLMSDLDQFRSTR